MASITGSKLSREFISQIINRLDSKEATLLRLYLTYELLQGTINDPVCLRKACMKSKYVDLFKGKSRFNAAYYCQQKKKK